MFTISSNTSTYFFNLRRKFKSCNVLIAPRAISLLPAFFSCEPGTKCAIEAARGNRQARGERDHVAEKCHRLPVNLAFFFSLSKRSSADNGRVNTTGWRRLFQTSVHLQLVAVFSIHTVPQSFRCMGATSFRIDKGRNTESPCFKSQNCSSVTCRKMD